MTRIDGRFSKNPKSPKFWGVVLFDPKYDCNVGSVMRSAQVFGANFVVTIGPQRYKRSRPDTTGADRNLPIWHFTEWLDFEKHMPAKSELVAVEMGEKSRTLGPSFIHPPRPIYVFGSEDLGLPPEVYKRCRYKLKLTGKMSINLSVCAGVIMYDFISKRSETNEDDIETNEETGETTVNETVDCPT